MDNRNLLGKLTQSFNRDDLTQFFRDSSGKFKPEKSDYSHYLEKANFGKNLFRLGRIDFEDGRRLIALVGEVDKELTSHSGKLNQYEIAKKVLKAENLDAGIFVFQDEAGHFRFSLITAQYKGAKREFSNFRRYTYFVSPDWPSHSFVNQIGKADFSSIEKILEAFSVEPVTKEFYSEYEKIFRAAETCLTLDWTAEKKRLYTQRFFNRLMFLTFLERKGWMNFNEKKDYLRALFADYYENETNKRDANFHKSRLNTLFFKGLNNPYGDQLSKDPEYKIFQKLIGNVPYLNGGLFEEEPDDINGPPFPDPIVVKILTDLIYHFNFTVTESTPLDVEVAVDPEMLGRIFEKLVTGRHESGSYYTIKPVVAFMCYEALAGYLQSRLPSESEAAITQFVYQKDPSQLRNPEAVLEALRAVKVCDPACGSGAYLLGMLHVLLELRECLFATRALDAKTVYERKLEIIQNNLYGVDKDPFAVNIARLRLWLSLIVDFEGEDPPPLPNLDFKIESGDSLTAPDPSGGLDLGFRRQLVDDFLIAKNKYSIPHDKNQFHYREQAYKLRDEIRTWSGRSLTFNSFDWVIEFAEIFIAPAPTSTITGAMAGLVNTISGQMELTTTPPSRTGFDIILANPPYVRADAQFKHIEDEEERQQEITNWQTYRKQLKDSRVYKTLHEKWDLYIPFLERAYQLLRPNGQMVFIIPDAYNAAKYAGKSHEFFLQNSLVERIDFCSEIDLFDAGVSNTILHFAKGQVTAEHQPVRARRWGKRDEFDINQELLPTLYQQESGKAIFILDGWTPSKTQTKHIELQNICYVSYGLRANADDREWQGEFTTEDCLSPKKDAKHPKPFVQGKDLVKWSAWRVWFLEWGTDRAPAKFSRPTFTELHNAAEKLIAVRTPGMEPKVIYDNQKYHFDASSVGFVPWHLLSGVINRSISKTAEYHHQNPLGDREQREEISKKFNLKYTLAIMNSAFAREWLKGRRRSKMHVYPDDWKQLPIAPISLEEQKEFVKLVDKILAEYERHGYPLPEKSAEKVREWEGQLDELVSRLY